MTIPLPADLPYGYVVGSFVRAAPDTADTERHPDGQPITDLSVTFTATSPAHTATTEPPALVVKDSRTCTVDANGDLLDETGTPGVWLVAGAWIVSYSTSEPVRIKSHSILVTAEHTETTPLHLSLAYPPPGPELDASEYAAVMARIDNLELGVTSWDEVTGKPAAYPPTGHAGTHATGGTDPITPASIGALAADGYVPAWDEVADKPAAYPPTGHAGAHAAGSSDPVTPASIGAVSEQGGDATDADAPLSSGMHRVLVSNITNPASFPADISGSVLYLTHWNYGDGSSYATQTLTRQYGGRTWVRALYGVWGEWTELAPLTDAAKDTGPRELTLPGDATGTYTVRRIGAWVYLRVVAAGLTTTAADTNVIPVPSGFRATRSYSVDYFKRSWRVVDTHLRCDEVLTNASAWMDFVYPADDPFPAEPYPGTPA